MILAGRLEFAARLCQLDALITSLVSIRARRRRLRFNKENMIRMRVGASAVVRGIASPELVAERKRFHAQLAFSRHLHPVCTFEKLYNLHCFFFFFFHTTHEA